MVGTKAASAWLSFQESSWPSVDLLTSRLCCCCPPLPAQLSQQLGSLICSFDLSQASSPSSSSASSLDAVCLAHKALHIVLTAAAAECGTLTWRDERSSDAVQPRSAESTTRRADLAGSISQQLQQSGVVQWLADTAATACQLLQAAASHGMAGPPGPSDALLRLCEQLMRMCFVLDAFDKRSGAAQGTLLQAMISLPLAALQAASTYVDAQPGGMPPDSAESRMYAETAASAFMVLIHIPSHPLLQRS